VPQNPRKNKKPSHKTTHSSKIHTITAEPVFGQPAPSPDPAGFKDPVTDQKEKELATLGEVPAPSVGAIEPVLTLEQVYGSAGAAKVQAIQQTGQLVFHCVGDTGSVVGPGTQSLVADKMVTDFSEASAADVPSFLFHLGDVVYYFGEATYYYDQFYEPYRNYQAPIIAIAGNHDGVVYSGDPQLTLAAFLRNFCSSIPAHSPDAGGCSRAGNCFVAKLFRTHWRRS
jgi:Calcineurin-like phosphoesterase